MHHCFTFWLIKKCLTVSFIIMVTVTLNEGQDYATNIITFCSPLRIDDVSKLLLLMNQISKLSNRS